MKRLFLILVLFVGAIGSAQVVWPTEQTAGLVPLRTEADDLKSAKQATDAGQWQTAAGLLEQMVARDPDNADAHNLLGLVYRHLGDYQAAFREYARALAIDPKHRGAHEYLGEAYLTLGDVQNAEKHLATLDEICFFGCEEFRELKAAIGQFKKAKGN